MPDIVKITELTELTSLAPGGNYWIPIVDDDEPVDANKNKRIAPENLSIDVVTILQAVYPVGSIYISVVATNPATLFGFGTWVAFATGRTIVGIDTGQTEFNTIEKTGGAKTHTLTTAEMPSHVHLVPWITLGGTGGSSGDRAYPGGNSETSAAGSGGAHNNLQPYITTYIWKRTA
jgi:hypothetical protein